MFPAPSAIQAHTQEGETRRGVSVGAHNGARAVQRRAAALLRMQRRDRRGARRKRVRARPATARPPRALRRARDRPRARPPRRVPAPPTPHALQALLVRPLQGREWHALRGAVLRVQGRGMNKY